MRITIFAKEIAALTLAHVGIARYELAVAQAIYDRRTLGRSAAAAAYWARRAAMHGSTKAMRLLASFYIAGYGIAQDYAKAKHFYKLAADAGDPEGMHSLAWCLFHGVGTERDSERAFGLWLEAARRGIAESQAAVADCLLRGKGVPVDLDMAMQWAELAYNNGASDAEELLNLTRKQRGTSSSVVLKPR